MLVIACYGLKMNGSKGHFSMKDEHHHVVQRTMTGIKISAKVTENATITHLYLGETTPPSARRFEVKYVTKTNNAATIRYHAKDLNCPWMKTMAHRMRNTKISNTNPINLKLYCILPANRFGKAQSRAEIIKMEKPKS
jgi:hypothetical protein